MDFIMNNWPWLLAIIVFFVMSIIGYYAERTGYTKKIKQLNKKIKSEDINHESDIEIDVKDDAIALEPVENIEENFPNNEENLSIYSEDEEIKNNEEEKIITDTNLDDIYENINKIVDFEIENNVISNSIKDNYVDLNLDKIYETMPEENNHINILENESIIETPIFKNNTIVLDDKLNKVLDIIKNPNGKKIEEVEPVVIKKSFFNSKIEPVIIPSFKIHKNNNRKKHSKLKNKKRSLPKKNNIKTKTNLQDKKYDLEYDMIEANETNLD